MKRLLFTLSMLAACSVSADTGVRFTGAARGTSAGGGGGGGDYTVYAADGTDHLYLNSSEIGCTRNTTTDSDVVLCDDFQDGDWYRCGYDDVAANGNDLTTQDGWAGTIYTDYGGSGCQWTPDSGDGPEFYGAATGGGVGVGGITYAADSGEGTNGTSGGSGHMAEHNLGPSNNEYDELWIRFYMQYASNANIQGNYKLLTINNKTAPYGGIWVGGLGAGEGDSLAICPVYDCNVLGYNNPQNTGGSSPYLKHNVSSFDFDAHNGNWIKVEIHIALESTIGDTGSRDGVWQLWADDCGSDGLSCPGTPTLRADFDNVLWRCPSGGCAESDGIRSLWLESQWDVNGGVSFVGDYTRFNFLRVEINRSTPIGAVELPN